MTGGFLSAENARRVTAMQREVGAPFSEVAQEMGVLSRRHAQELEHERCETHLHLAQALVLIGALSEAQMPELIKTWLARPEARSDKTPRKSPCNAPDTAASLEPLMPSSFSLRRDGGPSS